MPPGVQWRSCHGNSYPVFVRADVAALAQRIRQEKEAAERERLGSEEYDRRQKLAAAKTVCGCPCLGGVLVVCAV